MIEAKSPTAAERARARRLIQKHRSRLRRLEGEAIALAEQFANDYRGKVLFAVALATSAAALCKHAPGLRPESFIEDVKAAAAVWVELGEPAVQV